MAVIAAQPFTMKDVTAEIDGDDYKKHLARVRFDPNTPRGSGFRALAPDANYQSQGLADWSLSVLAAQDWANADSFVNYLLANEGDEVEITFRPIAGGVGFTSTITLAAPQIGGETDATATTEVTMACTKPVPVAALP